MPQNKSVEEVVEELLLRTYDRCFVRGRVPPEVSSSIAHYDMFLKEEFNTLIQQERQTSQEREREIVRRLSRYTEHSHRCFLFTADTDEYDHAKCDCVLCLS